MCVKILTWNWNSPNPRGKCESATTPQRAPHCGIVFLPVCELCPARAFFSPFIHLKVKTLTAKHKNFFHKEYKTKSYFEKKKRAYFCSFILTTIKLPHIKHCYFSFPVFMEDRLKLYCLMGSLWGNFLLKLCSAISSISVWTLAMSHVFRFFTENYHAGASGGHRHFHGITEAQWSHWATLSWRLSICHCSQPQPLALFSSLSFSVMRQDRNWSGKNVVAQWHDTAGAPTQKQTKLEQEGRGKSEKKVL